MLANLMVIFSGCTQGVDMDSGIAKIWQMMQEFMSHLVGHTVTFFNRQI